MEDPNKPNGGDGSGGGNPPASPQKTVEQRLADMEANATKHAAQLQSTQEELKRVNGLNGVLMQRLNNGGGGNPPSSDDRGMDVRNTSPIKLKRDFSQMDPAADPGRFATELVLETAEQVSAAMQRNRDAEASNANLRTAFYGKNKDLVGYEVEVGHFSNEVQSQNPGMPFDQASELIAQKTREYLKERGLKADPNNPNPPHTLPPASGGGDGRVPIKKPDGTGTQPFNADEEYAKDMKDYSSMRNKERERTGTKQS